MNENTPVDTAEIKLETRDGRSVVAHLIQVEKADSSESDTAGKSKQLPESRTFSAVENKIVAPRFNSAKLITYPEYSTTLSAAVDAYRTNIDGFGHLLAPRKGVEGKKSLEGAIEDESIRLTNFFQYASPEGSFTRLRKRTRKDLEVTGNAFWEILRDATGEIVGIDRIPTEQMRLGFETADIRVSRPVVVTTKEGYKLAERQEWRRFRTYVQGKTIGATSSSQLRWFKQLGDPRTYDNVTGDLVPEEQIASFGHTGEPMPELRKASEVYHWKIYAPGTPYGVPRYMGALLAILGSRKASEINFATLNSNNVPSLAILVSGGALTGPSIKRIQEYVQAQIRTSDNYSSILILEGESEFDGVEGGKIKIEIVPLTGAQIQDALFLNYFKYNKSEVRESFRLPPIFTGTTDTYNRATADTSRRLADEQVFAPERTDTDWVINTEILARMGIVYLLYRSRTPNVTDNRELIQMATAIEKAGGMTPRIARMITADVFPMTDEAPPIDAVEGINPDVSISYQLAQLIQSQANVTEPNQVVGPVTPSGVVKGSSTYFDFLAYQQGVDTELRRFMQDVEIPDLDDMETDDE